METGKLGKKKSAKKDSDTISQTITVDPAAAATTTSTTETLTRQLSSSTASIKSLDSTEIPQQTSDEVKMVEMTENE
jgi:hypothetical protein